MMLNVEKSQIMHGEEQTPVTSSVPYTMNGVQLKEVEAVAVLVQYRAA
jgi:hypothetical protein